MFGYDTGVISGALLFVKKDFSLSPWMQSVVTSAVLAGAAFGAGFSGRLADRFGRRRMVIAVAVLFFVASLLTGLAPGVWWLAVGRVFVGLAIGVCSYTAPLYISEISPAHNRGALVSMNQLLITVGILVSYVTDYALADGEHWRWMFALAAIPALILGIGMTFLPESPRWLVSVGQRERASQVLERVRSPQEARRNGINRVPQPGPGSRLDRTLPSGVPAGAGRGRWSRDFSADHRNQHHHLLRADDFLASRVQLRRPIHSGDCRSRPRQRAAHHPLVTVAGPRRPPASAAGGSSGNDRQPRDSGSGVSLGRPFGTVRLAGGGKCDAVRGIVCHQPGPHFLAADLRDLSAAGARGSDGSGDHVQLGIQSSGCLDLPAAAGESRRRLHILGLRGG